MASKAEIRRNTSILKNEIETCMIEFASDVIGYRLMALDEYKESEVIYIYADYNKEVKTKNIIEDALKKGKRVALPRIYTLSVTDDVKGQRYMKFHYITSDKDLECGYKGILEPKEDLPCADGDTLNGIIIMPMVGFDADRNRVGYGGGFYDRYLSSHTFKKKIGIAYEEQIADKVDDANENDIKPDVIVTQKNIYA